MALAVRAYTNLTQDDAERRRLILFLPLILSSGTRHRPYRDSLPRLLVQKNPGLRSRPKVTSIASETNNPMAENITTVFIEFSASVSVAETFRNRTLAIAGMDHPRVY